LSPSASTSLNLQSCRFQHQQSLTFFPAADLAIAASDWEALPAQILKTACELQLNALDNCAAACACKAWRTAANTSHIQAVHLHAASALDARQLSAFLRSRTSIDHLQLSDAAQASYSKEEAEAFSSAVRTLSIICHTLSANKLFASVILKSTIQLAGLKQLFVDCGLCFTSGPASNPLAALPTLKHLSELTALHLRVDSYRSVKQPEALATCLSKCPHTLQHLVLESARHRGRPSSLVKQRALETGGTINMQLSADVRQSLATNLGFLQQLQLVKCFMRAPDGFSACLSGLTSLSLHASTVAAKQQLDLTKLTRLVILDISRTLWPGRRPQVLDQFVGWPALRNLRIYKCSLFGHATILHIPLVQKLVVDYLHPSMDKCPAVNLCIQESCFNCLGMHGGTLQTEANYFTELFVNPLSPLWSLSLVRMHLFLDRFVDITFCVVDVISQLLHKYASMKELSFSLAGSRSHTWLHKLSTCTRSWSAAVFIGAQWIWLQLD